MQRSLFYLNRITEREVCQAVGPVAQFAANRSVHVPEQFPGLIAREAHGSQVYRRSAHFDHVLPYEGNIQMHKLFVQLVSTLLRMDKLKPIL